MTDARTPSTYFGDPQKAADALDALKGRLDDLLVKIHSLKQQETTTPAHKEIAATEIDRLEDAAYKERSKRKARAVVEEFTTGTPTSAADAIWEALEERISYRLERYAAEEGKRIEQQVFWSDLVGDK